MSFTARQLKESEGSHIPVLIKMLQLTEESNKPILELGTGFNSTPLLHWMCNEKKRKIVSYESSPIFWEAAKNYVKDFHEVHFIDDWDKLDVSQYWGIVFVDHAPGPRRVVEMMRLAQQTDYMIVHDTESKSDWHYKYSQGFPSYKYRYDYTKAYPHTSVLSNFIDVTKLDL